MIYDISIVSIVSIYHVEFLAMLMDSHGIVTGNAVRPSPAQPNSNPLSCGHQCKMASKSRPHRAEKPSLHIFTFYTWNLSRILKKKTRFTKKLLLPMSQLFSMIHFPFHIWMSPEISHEPPHVDFAGLSASCSIWHIDHKSPMGMVDIPPINMVMTRGGLFLKL